MIFTIEELYNRLPKADFFYMARNKGLYFVAAFNKGKIEVSSELYAILYNSFYYTHSGMFDKPMLSKMIIESRNNKLSKVL